MMYCINTPAQTHVELADEGHDGVLLRLLGLELADLVALGLRECGAWVGVSVTVQIHSVG